MDKNSLRLVNVSSGYDLQKVIHGISLNIEEGSVVGIIGPNGHGKSTLVKTVSGLVSTWSGQIFFEGLPIEKVPTHERVTLGVVHVPQGDLIFPNMTIEENLRLGAVLADDSEEVERRLDKVFDLFPVLLNRRVQVARTLSGGERRMLGIGRGLMTNGTLMLIDEPSLGLAPKLIDQIYNSLSEMKESGITFLIVEENISRLQALADWVYLMDNGEFVWSGNPDELQSNSELLSTYLGA
jgi:branched-chain amino acid transport system ATP-binding protein